MEMEGKSRLPEITIAPTPRPAAGGGAVYVAKVASREPISPGSPCPVAAGHNKESRATAAGAVAVALPGWKLDALCQDSSSSPAMRVRFPYF
ncbi:uncharacterized protein LOC133892692 [Phragmites australis]|uniref:uncharacterized protein LOC133892692 n=1 Tax=Phragmites australis TaxID=29695 RepID=UPI002D792910|nr:uncharacterized protein LOC133892692 [Phragmites australis]